MTRYGTAYAAPHRNSCADVGGAVRAGVSVLLRKLPGDVVRGGSGLPPQCGFDVVWDVCRCAGEVDGRRDAESGTSSCICDDGFLVGVVE